MELGNRTQVAAKSAVLRSYEGNQLLMGTPAADASQTRKIYSIISQLPQLRDRIRQLEEQWKDLQNPPRSS